MGNYRVVWRGPVHKASGLGIASREYVRALRRQGVDVKVDTGVSEKAKAGDTGKRKILIYHYPPSMINMNKERKRFDRIILNTVWETTRIPQRWMANINRFDAVCVPSEHNKTALRNSGVTVPIFVVPHGVYTQQFRPGNKKLPLKQAAGRFVFISVFGFQHRKNPEALLKAYWQEFSAKDRVLLVIKTNGYARYENSAWIKTKIARYKNSLNLRKDTAPIAIYAGQMGKDRIKQLYALGNVFVLPTRGEGVGLPFLESLASGVPVIATGWGGHMDFLTRNNSFIVAYKLTKPTASMNGGSAISRTFRHLFAGSGQRWAEPDIGSLRKQMRYAYSHPDLCRKKGRQGRQDMLRWSWDRAGKLFKQAIENVIG
ncbi:glycosyltransferase family 4 protein [Paenibacillus hamazuiensis]|uniref:glycosyltransferase family 4 protein n=1 Tax=Paenibacillus hamazuiensis TaxID=2936508 RepID=UPI00201049CB|nr:glycosyltransferase family 4 protein [Paenibacillus hamazuiensis]